MPDQLTSAGLQIKTLTEIVDGFVADLQAIYGSDINVASDSPDGQLLNIVAQAARDLRELLQLVYSGFGVTSAVGVALDERVALNGLQRQAGTFSLQPLVVTVDDAVVLQGLDFQINDPDGVGFTAADEAGNKWILAETHEFSGVGSATLMFRAKNIGAVDATLNTITNIITVVVGVTGVNNPGAMNTRGVDEESDAALRIRHARSFALGSVGPADAVVAAVAAVENVTDVFIPENTTDAVVDGVPAYGIWPIVEGGVNNDIAQAIYMKKAPGCALKGSVSVSVDRPAGNTQDILFDRPITQPLYVKFSVVPRVGAVSFDNDLIKSELVLRLVYKLNQSPNVGDVHRVMYDIAPLGYLVSTQVSANNADWFDVVVPTTFQHKFVLSADHITIL